MDAAFGAIAGDVPSPPIIGAIADTLSPKVRGALEACTRHASPYHPLHVQSCLSTGDEYSCTRNAGGLQVMCLIHVWDRIASVLHVTAPTADYDGPCRVVAGLAVSPVARRMGARRAPRQKRRSYARPEGSALSTRAQFHAPLLQAMS